MSARRPPYRITVPKYDKMIELGILTKYDRVELIRGELVAKMPISDLRASSVRRLNRLLDGLVRDLALIGINNQVRLSDSKPEPVITLLRPRDDFYARATPTPADVLLLIEVSDTTHDYDREVKRPLYAENGIAEYWIVNLVDNCLEVYREPRPDGTFADIRTLRAGESIALASLPGVIVAVAELF